MKNPSLIGANIHGVHFFPIGVSEETASAKPKSGEKQAEGSNPTEKAEHPTTDIN
jgi:hypothetical protein